MRVNTAQRMLILYQSLQATGEDMGIDLGCGQRGMAEQGLHYPQVCAIIEQMAGNGMAQHMRTYGIAIPASTANALRYLADPAR